MEKVESSITPTKEDGDAIESLDDPLDISSDSSQVEEDDKSFKFFENVNQKSFTKRVRLLERKILLGLLSDPEEERLRKSKYFKPRFEKLITLSNDLQKANLYKLISKITLNEKRITDLKGKPGKKSKIEYYQSRERSVQKKLSISALTQKELSGLIADPFFSVTFGDGLLTLEHDIETQLEESEQSASVDDDVLCDYCRQTAESNHFGQREELLVCKDCDSKAHPACLSYSEELAEQIRSDGSWQCINCKACSICDGTTDPDTLLFCDACDKGYHMTCHDPKLDKMPTGKWACASCLAKGKHVPSGSNSPITIEPQTTVSTPTPAQEVFIIDDDDEMKKPEDEEKMDDQSVAEISSPKTNSPKTALISPIVSSVSTTASRQTNAVQPVPVHPRHTNPTLHAGRPRIATIQPAGMYHYIPPGMQPRAMQMPVPIPYSVMPIPNGPTIPVPATGVIQNGGTPTVLGKGVQNTMTNILSPKVPLPDVRSSIREDVLRQLPPDVADWSVQDVSYYFKSHGYVTEGNLLEEQEIDGRALLLMSRNDVLTGLRIKLGPAIKIYHMHIQKLQTRTDFIG